MSKTNQFGLSLKEAREISQVNSLPGELKRVANLITMWAGKGEYRSQGVSVKLCHKDAIVDSLRNAGYVVEYGRLTFDKTKLGLDIYWGDPT